MERHWKRQNFKTKIVDGQKTEFVPDGKPGIPAISESGVITYFSFLLFEIIFIIVFKDR